MKMAKASAADLDAALKVSGALEAIYKGWWPEDLENDVDGSQFFDTDDAQHCLSAMNYLMAITAETSLFRVCFGMTVLLDPRNKMVDPAADTLEHHPRVAALVAALERLERWGRIIAGNNVRYEGDHPLAIAAAALEQATGSAV